MVNFDYEQSYWSKNLLVAGADEVGRGALAGPVVASTVVLAPVSSCQLPISEDIVVIDDSKKLTQKQREVAALWIRGNCIAYGIGEASAAEINRFGVVKATQRAYRRAISAASHDSIIDHLLIDAFYVPHTRALSVKKQTAISGGDAISFSIAAASIIAKVHRDNLMSRLSEDPSCEPYFWRRNKGYGTAQHRAVLTKRGPTKHHRKLFVRNFF